MYGQKTARFRGPAGTSGAAPEPQGAGTPYGAGGVGENDPVNKGGERRWNTSTARPCGGRIDPLCMPTVGSRPCPPRRAAHVCAAARVT